MYKAAKLVPEVLAAWKKLLQHDDDGIVEYSCKVVLALNDETTDIVQEVLPLMESASIMVRRLAKKIFSRMRLKNLIRAFVHQRIPLKYLPVFVFGSHGAYRAIVFVVVLVLYILIF